MTPKMNREKRFNGLPEKLPKEVPKALTCPNRREWMEIVQVGGREDRVRVACCGEFSPPLVLRGRVGVGVESRLAHETPTLTFPPEYQGRGRMGLAECVTHSGRSRRGDEFGFVGAGTPGRRLAINLEHHAVVPGGIVFRQKFVARFAAHLR